MQSVAGTTEGRSSFFSGETPIGSVSARREPSTTGTAAQATPGAMTPCFACEKTDVGQTTYRPSNSAWAAVAIICLNDHRYVRSCSLDAKICTLSCHVTVPSRRSTALSLHPCACSPHPNPSRARADLSCFGGFRRRPKLFHHANAQGAKRCGRRSSF
jgi:hypothetical protein